MEQKMNKQTKLEIAFVVVYAVITGMVAVMVVWRFYDWMA